MKTSQKDNIFIKLISWQTSQQLQLYSIPNSYLKERTKEITKKYKSFKLYEWKNVILVIAFEDICFPNCYNFVQNTLFRYFHFLTENVYHLHWRAFKYSAQNIRNVLNILEFIIYLNEKNKCDFSCKSLDWKIQRHFIGIRCEINRKLML